MSSAAVPEAVAEAVLLAEAVLVAEVVPPEYAAAAGLLEQAVRLGRPEPQAAYLLALACKRQGKTAEARAALRTITKPDANVFLQLGLLSLREQQPAQAEEEFARAWELDPTCYPAGHNLLLTRLTLDKIDDAEAMILQVQALARSPGEQRFLALLQALLRTCQSADSDRLLDPALLEMTPEDEQRLLELAQGLGQMDT